MLELRQCVVWCGVGVCLCLLARGKNYKERDNAVDDLSIPRKWYHRYVRGAIHEGGPTSCEKMRRCDDAMTHTRRAQLLPYVVKQLLLYIPGSNHIIRVPPKKDFATAAAVDTRIALIIGRNVVFSKCITVLNEAWMA